MNTLRNTVAKNIAAYRKRAGLTQSELAEKLCYSDKSVSKWERAEGMPDTETLVAMAEIFGVTINELISADPYSEKNGDGNGEHTQDEADAGNIPSCEVESAVSAEADDVAQAEADNSPLCGDGEVNTPAGGRYASEDTARADSKGEGVDVTVESAVSAEAEDSPLCCDGADVSARFGGAAGKRRGRPTLADVAVTLISVTAVWALCGITVFFFSTLSPSLADVWNIRIAAYFGVISLLVWYIFAALRWGRVWRHIMISALTWSAAAALHVSFPSESIVFIYAVAAAFQLIIVCAALIAFDRERR